MDFAIYKCEQCGKKIHLGLRGDQLYGSQLGFSDANVEKEYLHQCDENTVGIAKLVGFTNKTD